MLGAYKNIQHKFWGNEAWAGKDNTFEWTILYWSIRIRQDE